MGFQEKRVTWRLALSLLGLVTAPLAARASDLDADSFHINLGVFAATVDSDSANLGAVPTRLVPAYAQVTAPNISGVDLFSNQAVFSFSGVSYLENTPVSALHANADESLFWDTTIAGGGTNVLGMPTDAQQAVMAAFISNSSLNSDTSGLSLNGQAVPSATTRITDTSLDTPNLPGMRSLANGSSNAPVASSLQGAANSAALVPLANPVLSRDSNILAGLPDGGSASPDTLPEPASIGLLGIFAVGLLGRRRAAR